MTAIAKTVLESALALPEAERMAIADALLESLPEDSDELDDEAFAQELRRRSEEMDRDPSMGISWEEVKKML